MREKERARQERLKRKKEEKLQKRKNRGSDDREKFAPPPMRLNEKEWSQKARKSSFL